MRGTARTTGGLRLLRVMASIIPAFGVLLYMVLSVPNGWLTALVMTAFFGVWTVLIFRHMKDRLTIEARMKRAESNFLAVMEGSPDAVVILDDDDRILAVNRAAREIFGLRKDPETGRRLSESCGLPNWDNFRPDRTPDHAAGRFAIEWQAHRENDGAAVETDIVIGSTVIGGEPVLVIHMSDMTEQKRMERVLLNNEGKFSTLFDAVDVGILIFEGTSVSDVNETAIRMFGYATRDFLGMTPVELSASRQRDGGDSADVFDRMLRRLEDGRARIQFSWIMRRSDGSFFDSEVTLVRKSVDGAATVMAFVRDVTERLKTERDQVAQLEELLGTREVLSRSNTEMVHMYRELEQAGEKMERQLMHLEQARQELLRSTERYRLAADGSNDIIWDWDVRTRKLYLSDRFYELMGYDPDRDVITYDVWKNLVHPDDRESDRNAYNDHLAGLTDRYSVEKRLREKDGSWRWFLASGRMILEDGVHLRRFAGSLTDITERKHMENIIGSLSYFDRLTDLPNRTRLLSELETRIGAAGANEGGALMFIDLDDFKVINDTFGHNFGDRVLKEVAERIRTIVSRWPDTLVARFGDDEFMVMAPRSVEEDRTQEMADEVLLAFREPFQIEQARLGMTCSIGIAMYPDDANSYDMLVKRADTALNRAKRAGKKQIAFFSREMEQEVSDRMEMVAALRDGIEQGELQLYYQPILRGGSRTLVGFEALVRWNKSRYGFVPPAKFIQLAEETGLIFPLGRWVMGEACRFSKVINEVSTGACSVSVNVAPIQFLQGDLAEEIAADIEAAGIDCSMLGVEITESTLVENFPLVTETMLRLRERGLHLYLDDFGTGYSSLSYLRRLPIDILKIDKSFIDSIHTDETGRMLVESIIHMAHGLDISVVAEGVEHAEQAEILERMGCDMMQGYHFSRPLPEAQALAFLSEAVSEPAESGRGF